MRPLVALGSCPELFAFIMSLDGHRKLVGSSEFQQGHAQGQFGIIGEVS